MEAGDGDRETEGRLCGTAHLGIGCASRARVDELCERARTEGCLMLPPRDAGPPVGYWALLRDPDGHNLELSFGQEIGLAALRAEEGTTGGAAGTFTAPSA
jgi:hypothetical protein